MWTFLAVLTYILFWLTCIISYTVHYLTTNIQITSFSQVIYTLSAGTQGAEGTIGEAVGGFFAAYWPLLTLGTLLFGSFLYFRRAARTSRSGGIPLFSHPKAGTVFSCSMIAALLITASCLTASTVRGYSVLGIGEYLANRSQKSTLFETEYVQPDSVAISFPEKKRNLIHIVMESMETSYADTAHGGGYSEHLIPELTAAAKSGTDFTASKNSALNGAYVPENTGWTIAGLVAQSAGTPLSAGHDTFRRQYGPNEAFMPSLVTLGDILKDEGYRNYFMCGSAATYAGRASYYKQHGDHMLLDLNAARTTGFVPADYSVWWGYEDSKLFDWAKQRITKAAGQPEPFSFTILTADTHFQDGYQCPDCPDTYDHPYKNVISCSDHRIMQFIAWLQQQDFYKDTTIVLSGDHLSMDGSVLLCVEDGYQRKVYTAVLNGPEYTLDKDRQFSTLDLFPTMLEAMGAQIEGHRLGLGTSLYADVPTLVEAMGLEELNTQLSRQSDYYSEVIMSGNTIEGEPESTPGSHIPAKEKEDEASNPDQPLAAAGS